MPDAASLIDAALEISIVGSFSRPGYLLRRRLFDWDDPVAGALEGQTVVITGPTSGLGRAAATALASLGANLVLVGRNETRLSRVRDDLIAESGEDRYRIVVADLSSLADARHAVESIMATEDRLDVVIDSAGAIHAERTTTDDGLEATFATMVVSPFVLIAGLLPLLEQHGGGRVISVVSGGMYAQALDLDDLQSMRGEFNGTLAYARAKRAATALVREWPRRLRDRPVRINAMHPGWADTPGLAHALPGFHRLMGPMLRTPAEGVDTITWLAAHPSAGSRGGQLFLDRRPRPFDRIPTTRSSRDDRQRLWDMVVDLSGVGDPTA